MVGGKLLYTKELFLLILIDGKYGFINKDIVINLIYEVASNFIYWLAGIRINKMWGIFKLIL